MKKLLSLVLCGLFLNLTFYPAVFAYDEIQPSNQEQAVTNTVVPVQAPTVEVTNAASSVQDSTAEVSDESTAVKDSTAEVSDTNQDKAVVEQPELKKAEHLSIKNNKSKIINVESVYVSSHDIEIPAQDILQLAFVNDFNGRKAHIGDTIEFRFPNDIVTDEGTVIIPSTAKIVAEITDLKRPKPLHLSGKVYLNFKYIEINGTEKPIQAKLYGKKDFLSRKALNNTVAVGETAAVTGAGAAAGAIICASTTSDVAMLVFGTAISAGVGAIAGVAVGILLPGAAFKAKAGQRVNIQLTQELDL